MPRDALILDGQGPGTESAEVVRDLLVGGMERRGYRVRSLPLREMAIRHCTGCFGCWVRTPGVCVIPDEGRDVAREAVRSDLLVFFGPVTFGGYSPELKKAVDRIVCPMLLPFFVRVEGEVRHPPRYGKRPRLLAVGLLAEADEEAVRIFTTLAARNARNLHTPHAAGVVSGDWPAGKLRARIRELLEAVGGGP